MQDILRSFKWTRDNKRWEDKRKEKLTRGFHGPTKLGVEEMANYKCSTASCQCKLKLARFKGGIIVYENCDTSTNEPFKHTGHNLRPDEQKQFREGKTSKPTNPNAKSKYDDLSLTTYQKEFIATKCDMLVASGKFYDIALAMVKDKTVACSPGQTDDLNKFADRIRYYVSRERKKGVEYKDEFSGESLENIFDSLKQDNRTGTSTIVALSRYVRSDTHHLGCLFRPTNNWYSIRRK